MIGPGKAFDTTRDCVICTNVLGGCYGTTGPSSIDPATGRPYGLRFPAVTVGDMVTVQKRLLDRLGVTRLKAVAGGSMGGMQALQWVASYPDFVGSVIAIATTPKHSPQQIAFNEIARRAVMADPRWRGGDYPPDDPPADGLAVARMVGHVTYLSDRGMQRKFGRRRRDDAVASPFGADFDVERYLDHQGRAFVDRFDANTLLYLTKALDRFDFEAARPAAECLSATDAAFLLLAFSSDWLYPAYQLDALAADARAANRQVVYHELSSDCGHDAFLLEHEAQAPIIRRFLTNLERADPFAHTATPGLAVQGRGGRLPSTSPGTSQPAPAEAG